MYDLLIVGAGLTSAVLCSKLKHKYNILVVDVRSHIGGNCHDFLCKDTYIHPYGPHIFHTKHDIARDFFEKNTEVYSYMPEVVAEIPSRQLVPFPYSKDTEKIIGTKTQEEIIKIFFDTYSKKMWGKYWNELPEIVRKRVPSSISEKSLYFQNQWVYLPKNGYNELFNKLFSGVSVKLNCGEHYWTTVKAKRIIYCGRIDRILLPNDQLAGDFFNNWLNYRHVEIFFKKEEKIGTHGFITFCNEDIPYTRKTIYGNFMNTDSQQVSYELPYKAYNDEINPFYPLQYESDLEKYDLLKNEIQKMYPNMVFAGRIGGYKYIDMDQSILNGLTLSYSLQ